MKHTIFNVFTFVENGLYTFQSNKLLTKNTGNEKFLNSVQGLKKCNLSCKTVLNT